MPDLKSLLDNLNINTTTGNVNSQLPTNQSAAQNFLKNIGALDLLTKDPVYSGEANTGISNQNFDPERTEWNKEVSNTGFQNWYNTFRQSWKDMKIASEIGKMNLDAGSFGQGALLGLNQSVEEIVDNYPSELAKLDTLREQGVLNDNEYNNRLSKLQKNFNEAQTIYNKSLEKIAELESEKSDFVVSKSFAAKTQRAMQKGDDLGFVENMSYAMPQVLGSSASLMIPQMAAAFGAGFAKSAAATVASTLGVGTKAAPVIGTLVGLGSALATLVWGRAEESYGEVGSLIKESREKMMSDYMLANGLTDPSQIPNDVLYNIKAKSRLGSEMLFKENMALVVPDLISATLLPMNTLGKTIGIGKGFNKISGSVGEYLTNAKNYNLLTKGLTFAASRRYAQYLEQFEEGLQYAASDRAKHEIYGLSGYQNKGFISNLLDDGINTIASLNYTLLPGITPELRGSGKYSLDPEFQSSDNSGGLLALVMSGPTAALKVGNELMAYRKAKQDIVSKGLFDVDSKFERLNADLLRSYFAKGQTEKLVTAIRAVGDKEDANGKPYYTSEEGSRAIEEIRAAYKLYQGITDNLGYIPKKGLLEMFDSKQQREIRNVYESDAFTNALNLRRQHLQLQELNKTKSDILKQEYIFGDNIETENYKDLLAKKEALEKLIEDFDSNKIPNSSENTKQNFQKELDSINSQIAEEVKTLKEINIDAKDISNPTRNLVNANAEILVLSEYNKQQKEIFNKLNSIKTEQDLIDYYNNNKNRIVKPTSDVANTNIENTDTVVETRTPEEIIRESTEGFNPEPNVTPESKSGAQTVVETSTVTPVNNTDPMTILSNLDSVTTEGLAQNEKNKILKDTFDVIFSTPNPSQSTIQESLSFVGLDPKKNSFEEIWNTLKQIIDHDILKNNFDNIKSAIQSLQNNPNTDITLIQDTVDLDNSIVAHKYDSTKVDISNSKIETEIKENIDPNSASTFKITDPLSVATKNVNFDNNENSYENGKLVFRDTGDDQHLVNSNAITTGQKVTISLANPNALNEINLSSDNITSIGSNLNENSSNNMLDNLDFEISVEINGNRYLIGYLHKIGYFTPDSFENKDMSVSEARQAMLQQRLNLVRALKKNPNVVFESTINYKGFGHLTLNDKNTFSTIQNAIGNDARPYITIVNEAGLPIERNSKPTYQNIGALEAGASILMIPNEFRGFTQYIPLYLTKQSLSNDSRAFNEVKKGIEEFYKEANNVWGSGIDQWIYIIRNNDSRASKLSLNGIGMSVNPDGTKSIRINNVVYSYNRNTQIYQIQGTSGPIQTVTQEEFYNGVSRNGLNLKGLDASIGEIYPSFNKEILNNSKLADTYQKKMMSSSLYKTRLAQNRVLATSNYDFLDPNQQYQYFAQHTISIDSKISVVNKDITIPKVNAPELTQTINTTSSKDFVEIPEYDDETINNLENKLNSLIKLNEILGTKDDEISELQSRISFLKNKEINSNNSQENTDAEIEALKTNSNTSSQQQNPSINSKEDLEDLLGDIDLDGVFDVDVSESSSNTSDISNNLFIDRENIPYSVQLDIINSVSYMLLDNSPDETLTNHLSNSDKVKEVFDKKLKSFKDTLPKINQEVLPVEYEKLNKLITYYQSILNNWDKIISMSKNYLESVGFVADPLTEYYDNLEESLEDSEESETVQFNDDSNRTSDLKDSIPPDVKKLLYFIPSLRKLDESNPKDAELIAKTGKNYTSRGNGIGMPDFNNFNDTWVKILNLTTDKYFSSDKATGWNKLIKVLSDPSNAFVVREFANKLNTVSSKMQTSVFNTIVLQRQNNVVSVTNLRETDSGAIKKTSIMEADRSTTVNNLFNKLKTQFLESSIITSSTDSITGREVKVVNTVKGDQIYQEVLSTLKDSSSYEANSKARKFTPTIKDKLFNLVYAAGIKISRNAFDDILNLYVPPGVSHTTEVANFKYLFESKILRSIAGHNKNSISSDGDSSDTNLNNPFINDYNAIRVVVQYEANYREDLQHGSVRQGKKTYYPFIKPHFLSELFTKISESVKYGLDKTKFGLNSIIDSFAKSSKLTESIVNNSTNGFNSAYELGARLRIRDKSGSPKLLKDMTPREHQITKLAIFQNSGNRQGYFLYDTLSDKSTMPFVVLNKIPVEYSSTGTIDGNSIVLSDNVLTELFRYADNEYSRIRDVQEQNKTLDSSKQIKGYHGKNGMSTKFISYSFLNKEMLDISNPKLSSLMYNVNGELNPITPIIIDEIKREINKNFNIVFANNKKDLAKLGLYTSFFNDRGVYNASIENIIDINYLTKGDNKSIANRLGLTNNPNWNKFLSTGDASVLGNTDVNKIVDYVVVDYVVNYSIKTNEMLQLTGDPAQAGKMEKIKNTDYDDIRTTAGKIRNKYKDLPNGKLYEARDILQLHINSTLNNLSKRNAAFLGSGSKGLFESATYNVAIANDININEPNSPLVEYYKSLFPGREGDITKAYQNGDMSDAQEVTTVKEKLSVMMAFSEITKEQMLLGLYKYDKEHFDKIAQNNTEYQEFAKKVTPKMLENFGVLIMQPDKPVQRMGILDGDLKMNKQFYIKTSSFPLIPELVKGTPLEKLLRDMQANDIDRLAFVSGVKQGVAGANNLFNENGDYNENFLSGNKNTLNRDGFRIQLKVPYKPNKDSIREGTQQSKMLFVDIPDDMLFGDKTARELKSKYKDLHREIFEINLAKFLEEVDAEYSNGTYRFKNLNKLAQVLQREAVDRGYGLNSILGLNINENGKFEIPLTFSPVASKIEPVITAIITNRMLRNKLPGHSYIQGSEFILNSGKGKIVSGENINEVLHTDDKRNIVWTDPKYANTSKLGYLTKDDSGIKYAQLLMTPYIQIGGKRINIKDYTVEVDGKTYIDKNRIDPSLLQTNGFRIPFQGHNSGMWFEIIGFLPEECGDLVIVPGEIAAQMGSDYDVDKLYAYMYNYYMSGDSIKRIDNKTTLNQINRNIKENNIVLKNALSKRIESEKIQNELLNSLFSEDDKLTTDENLLRNSLLEEVLDELGLDKSELKYYTQQDLDIKKKQNEIIDIHKLIYTGNEELFTSILDPLSFDVVNQAIAETEEFSPQVENITNYVFDPLYQRDVYFSNSMGKKGTAISALANTSHAQAQETYLFIKGEGIIVKDVNGNIFSDSAKTNRTTKYKENIYSYEVNGEVINAEQNVSAWRLDKIYTFPDKSGKVYKISSLISQILGVSVDNAKEQVLGKFGINNQNFNQALTLVRLGFDLATVKKIITQPILVEFNNSLADISDMYTVDYTPSKKNNTIRKIVDKYQSLFNLPDSYKSDEFLQDSNNYPIDIQELEDSLILGSVSEQNAINQLRILKTWLKITNISDSLRALQSAYNLDSSGLPKNITDVIKKQENVENISIDDNIGNINIYAKESLPSVYSDAIPLSVDLFTRGDNPLFLYNSLTYRSIHDSVLTLTGKNLLFEEQVDKLNREIKSFVYTNFISESDNLDTFKQEILFDNPISERYNKLFTKYPRDKFLGSIVPVSTNFINDPVLLEIAISSEDNYVQQVSEAWEYAYKQNIDSELKQFAIDFFKYALALSPQEIGTSSIIRYVPFTLSKELGFYDYLNRVNEELNMEYDLSSKYFNFLTQFLQHNIDFTKSVKSNMIVKGSLKQFYIGTGVKGTKSFKLPALDTYDNPAYALTITDSFGQMSYPEYLSFFTNDTTGKQLFVRTTESSEGVEYVLMPSLGKQNVSEYDGSKHYQQSIFSENKFTITAPVNSIALSEILKSKNQDHSIYQQITIGELLDTQQSVSDILRGLDSIISRYSENSTGLNKANADYYSVIINKLQELNYSDVDIKFVNEGFSNTSSSGNSVVINKKKALSDNNKVNLNSDLNVTRVILHELLHSAIFRSDIKSEEYKAIEKVYNTYKDHIYSSKERIRGINAKALTGEIFSILIDNINTNKVNINSIEGSEFTYNQIKSLLPELSKRLLKLANLGKIEKKESLYNFDNTTREKEIINYIQEQFKSHRLSSIINEYYPYFDINEFITEATTNPKTQEILKSIPSIWEEIVKAIKNLLSKVLGVDNSQRNLFDDAIDAIFNFIDSSEIIKNSSKFDKFDNDISNEDFSDVPFDLDVNENYLSDIKLGVEELFESNPELANAVYEALGFKQKLYASKLKEISERRKLATKWDLENSQLIKDIRVDKTQPKTLEPNEADKNLASIMLYGHRYSDLSNGEYIDDNLFTITTNPAEMQLEAETLAYRILNDFMFDINELVFYQDILLENPEYTQSLATNENPVKEFFENDIFEQVEKNKPQITPTQKQQAQIIYSQYLEQNPNGSIQGFKEFVNNNSLTQSFDLDVNLSNFNRNNNQVDFTLTSINILNSDKATQIFNKGIKNNWTIEKIVQELNIPRVDKPLVIESYNEGNKNPKDIALDLAAKYSYTVEINTATKNEIGVKETYNPETGEIDIDNIEPDVDYIEEYDEEGNIIGMKPVLSERGKKQLEEVPTQYYFNLTVPGGTNYTENKIETPAIVPSIQGHAAWVKSDGTDKGIGWFRSDERDINSFLQSTNNKGKISKNLKNKGNILPLQEDIRELNLLILNNNSVKAQEIADIIVKSNTNNSLVIKKIIEILPKDYLSNVNVLLTNDFGGGFFDGQTITMGKSYSYGSHIFTHELLHLLSSHLLNKSYQNPKRSIFHIEMEKLYNFSKDELVGEYGVTDLEEFISETFSNSEFQQKLASIEYDKNKKTSLFIKFIQIFKDILGINNSVLEAAFSILENTTNSQNNFIDGSKTRRILEVQSDLFQKGRDSNKLNKQNTPTYNKGDIITTDKGKFEFLGYFVNPNTANHYVIVRNIETNDIGSVPQEKFEKRVTPEDDVNANKFLQLLNKDNNWVTFFIKSIIQDSAKKGYEKVLFPKGDTASKIEGHTTLEEFKKQKEDRIKELEKLKIEGKSTANNLQLLNDFGIESETPIDKEINQLKQELERVEREGFGALKPIYNFYENTVTNILRKNFNINEITDEYGNKWNELDISYLNSPSISDINNLPCA